MTSPPGGAGTLGRVRLPVALAALVLVLAPALAGCGSGDDEPAASDAVEAPQVGACRVLGADDVARPDDTTKTVDCAQPHTAETYAVGDLPAELQDAEWDSEELGAWAYQTCSQGFQQFLGADESTVMRTVLSWAWFRPSEAAWDAGARWYRCDLVGGGEKSASYVDLPATSAAGLLADRPDDQWMVCVDGQSVESAPKIPCTEKHNWRAVTTIKVGEPGDPYPGDRPVEVTTRDYCSQSVAAWLGYPPEYDFGYTWFHEGEWKAGNRRSICWAKTAQ